LVAGKYLNPGTSIRTGENGVVDVVLGKAIDLPQAKWVPTRISLAVDSPVRGLTTYRPAAEQNVVRVMSGSILVIDKLTTTSSDADTVSDTELDLKKGGIYASVKKLSPAAQYIVKTPTGIAGVRGTEFALTLNADGTIQGLAVYKVQDPSGGVVLVPDPAVPGILIIGGQMYQAGNPNPVPIPPTFLDSLQKDFATVKTVYVEVVNYNYDTTLQFESSDYGLLPPTVVTPVVVSGGGGGGGY